MANVVTPDESEPWNHQNMMTRTLAHYDVCEQIGEGTYGQVYRALSKDTKQVVALKKMRIHHGGYMGMPAQLVREIKILKRLRHPNLLHLIEVVTSKGVEHLDPDDPPQPKHESSSSTKVIDAREKYKGNLFLVLEYVPHDLTGLLDIGYQFTPVQIKSIVYQLMSALSFMHRNKYVHRDIKSSNILLDSNFRLKLADFGLARSLEPPILEQLQPQQSSTRYQFFHEGLTNKVITLWYRPPELLLGATEYGPAVDVWSAGCILAELMLGKPLFPGRAELDQFQYIVDLLGSPPNETWEFLQNGLKKDPKRTSSGMTINRVKHGRLRDKYEAKLPEAALSLLERLLDWDPRKRVTAANALEHRYFWTQPVAPEDPSMLGSIFEKEGVHFHEFQTKKKRKQAKAQAEEAREEALAKGRTSDEAQKKFDKVYQSLMKRVAAEGFEQKDPESKERSAAEAAQGKSSRTETRQSSSSSKRRRDSSSRRHGRESGESRSRGRREGDKRLETEDGDEEWKAKRRRSEGREPGRARSSDIDQHLDEEIKRSQENQSRGRDDSRSNRDGSPPRSRSRKGDKSRERRRRRDHDDHYGGRDLEHYLDHYGDRYGREHSGREHGKESDAQRYRDRDDHGRDRERSRGRDRDSRKRDREEGSNKTREENETDHGGDRDRRRPSNQDRDMDREMGHDLERDAERDRRRSADQEHGIDRPQDKDRGEDSGRDRRDRSGRGPEHADRRDGDRERHRSGRRNSREWSPDRSRGRPRRERERSPDRGRDRWQRSPERDRESGRDRYPRRDEGPWHPDDRYGPRPRGPPDDPGYYGRPRPGPDPGWRERDFPRGGPPHDDRRRDDNWESGRYNDRGGRRRDR